MSGVATKVEKDTSKTLGKQAKTASKVLTSVSGGKKGVVSYVKTGVRTAKNINKYYKGEYVAGGITGKKPTLKTGIKHLANTEVLKAKGKIATGKMAIYKAGAGDYSDAIKITANEGKKAAKKGAKAGAKITKLQSEMVEIQNADSEYAQNKMKELNTRVATKPLCSASKKAATEVNNRIIKPINDEVNKRVIKPIKDNVKKAAKEVAKGTVDISKKIFVSTAKLGKSAISLFVAFPVLLIPVFFLVIITCVSGAGGNEYNKNNITPAEGWLFPAKTNNGINAGTWSYGGNFESFGTNEHLGVDLAVSYGEPLLAVADGYILRASDGCTTGYLGNTGKNSHGVGGASGGGNMVMLVVPVQDKLYSVIYCHMQSGLSVKTGDIVKAGDVIGRAGSTGNSSGTHCHIEIALVGKAEDYSEYIKTWHGWDAGAGWQGNNKKCSDTVTEPCRIRPETVFGIEK